MQLTLCDRGTSHNNAVRTFFLLFYLHIAICSICTELSVLFAQSYLGSKPGAGRREAVLDAAVAAAAGGRRGPSTGACGTVVMTFADHPGRVRVAATLLLVQA